MPLKLNHPSYPLLSAEHVSGV